jgi:hypothetical protein
MFRILGISLNWVKDADFSPDICSRCRRKIGRENLGSSEHKKGNRAEVRRERKKRDILSPVNVLGLSNFQYIIKLYIKQYFFSEISFFSRTKKASL